MNSKNKFPKPLLLPEPPDFARIELPSISVRYPEVPWPVLPEQMLIVIDGWGATDKGRVAYWVAYALGGLFLDVRWLPLYLAKAFALTGANPNDRDTVAVWSCEVNVEVAFSADPKVPEGWIGVNGHWFNKDEIGEYAETALLLLRFPEFCEALTSALLSFEVDDRLIILGDDVITEVPESPYKFFFDRFDPAREGQEKEWLANFYTGDERAFAETAVRFAHNVSTTLIDSDQVNVGDGVMIVLMELCARADEIGSLALPLSEIFQELRTAANHVRDFVNSAYSHTSSDPF